MHLLDLVGLADQAQKLPGMVSGGQQQRAAIARALANDPALLVADEPTGNLDAKTAGQVFDIFMQLVQEQGKTMLMVTHDKDLADRVPREIEIVNGVIVSDGRPENSTEWSALSHPLAMYSNDHHKVQPVPATNGSPSILQPLTVAR